MENLSKYILRPIRPYLFTLLGIFNLTDIHNESRHGNLGKPQSSHFYTVSVKVNIVLLFPSCGQWPFLMKLLEYLYITGYPQCHQACLVPLHHWMRETRSEKGNEWIRKKNEWNQKLYSCCLYLLWIYFVCISYHLDYIWYLF